MATHSSILVWKLPGTEESGGTIVHRVTESQTRLSKKKIFLKEVLTFILLLSTHNKPCNPITQYKMYNYNCMYTSIYLKPIVVVKCNR